MPERTGKNAKDIFAGTLPSTKVGKEAAPRTLGRPKIEERAGKVTIGLYDRQTLALDKIALGIRERTGEFVSRTDLVRAIIDQGIEGINPAKLDAAFDKAVRDLLPDLGAK